MEFNEKLQELRRKKGLTQEELASHLYVSRTAVSKWESGRGYPNMDSLRAIAKFYSVTLDELLSSDEVLRIAEEDGKEKEKHVRDVVYGLLDCCALLFLFLPFFTERREGVIQIASLFSLDGISLYLKISYFVVVIGMLATGVLTLALQNCQCFFWIKSKAKISLAWSVLSALLFIISLQPYAAVFSFALLIIKIVLLLKRA